MGVGAGMQELTYNFIAGNEGIPAWDEQLEKLQHDFSAAFKRSSPDFQVLTARAGKGGGAGGGTYPAQTTLREREVSAY